MTPAFTECQDCDGCGWCEGSPAWTCDKCHGTGLVCAECYGKGKLYRYHFSEASGRLLKVLRGECRECDGGRVTA